MGFFKNVVQINNAAKALDSLTQVPGSCETRLRNRRQRRSWCLREAHPPAPARPPRGWHRCSNGSGHAGAPWALHEGERYGRISTDLREQTNLIRSHTAWYRDSRVSVCLGTDTSSGCPYSTAPEDGLDGRDFLSRK